MNDEINDEIKARTLWKRPTFSIKKIPLKIFLPILFLLTTSITYSHQDVTFSQNDGNLYLHNKTGWTELEIHDKLDIFYQLLNKMRKAKKYDKIPCYIYFNHNYTNSKPSYYTLNYEKFDFVINDFDNKDIEGLHLVIRKKNFDIKELLNLMNSAFENIEFIKKSQKQVFFDLNRTSNGIPQFDTLNSIESHIIDQYKQQNNSIVNLLIQEKIYRHKEYLNVDYFYQNNQFHFYNKKNEVVITTNDIFEIFGDTNNSFVFTNDSTFYHFAGYNVSKAFTIKNMTERNSPIYEFHHEIRRDNAPEKFFLIFNNYSHFKKVLFIPYENTVISNYMEIENEWIDGFINSETEKEESEKSLIWIILSISLVFNGWLFLRFYRQ